MSDELSSVLPMILIVDDNDMNLLAIQTALSEVNCELVLCHSGEEALEIIMLHEFALILLDVQMPGIDGFETATIMRQNKHFSKIPIIFVTAISKEQCYVEKGHEVGAVDYLFKPINTTILISKVNIFLDYYIKNKELSQMVERLTNAQDLLEVSNKELDTLARFDSVTGLANRVDFADYLSREIAVAKRFDRVLAVLFLDLDNFKYVNDSYGHQSGDDLLCQIGKRLKQSLRGSDIVGRLPNSSLVSRLGGDEFAVVLTDIASPESAAAVARRILENLEENFQLKSGIDISIGASIGIACYPLGGTTHDELCKNADMAMYDVKKMGKNSYRFYSEELNKMHRHHVLVEEGLRTALRGDAFYLVYQPIIDLASSKVVAVEVLCRCSLPSLEGVSPQEFILIAEESGLMQELGCWIFSSALEAVENYILPTNKDLQIHINVSAKQLQDDVFLKHVEKHYDERPAIVPKNIIFELTETAIMHDTKLLAQHLTRLTAKGSHVSIDDFGTGYSSMAWLRHLPISSLKIDKEFVSEITNNPNDAIITKSIIKLAENLELSTIAEGIEEQQHLDFLIDHGCVLGQGYFFSKPLVIDELIAYLKKHD
ncbi:MAG: EAL domain-containing protein [Coxiellaceae bacterium]|nr:EAL domain-containing protein [Coxiellaceae bacterium]